MTVPAPPREFLLELPESIAQKLADPQPFGGDEVPLAPWTVAAMSAPPSRSVHERMNLLMVLASVILGCALVGAGMTGIAPEPNSGPVGIAMHTPKMLDKSVRTRDRMGGVSSRTVGAIVSIDSLARPRHRRF